jgi:transposase
MATRVQELDRQKAGFASTAVAASIAAHLDGLDRQIEAVFAEVRRLVDAGPALRKNLALIRSITGFGEISAAILLAGPPDIAEFTSKALAAFAGLSPSEHSSGSSRRSTTGISRIGSERLRRTLFMCALSAKRTNKTLIGFVDRMTAAGKPSKVVPVAVARKLLVHAHAVVRTQKPFASFPDAASPA